MRLISVPGFDNDLYDLPPDEKADAHEAPYWSRTWRVRPELDDLPLIEDARGWPLLSVRCQLKVREAANSLYCSGVQDGIPLDEFVQPPPPGSVAGVWIRPPILWERVIPLRPIWPGFLINTLFYAIVAAAFIIAPLSLRRMIRQRVGRCGACGYPVASSTCPECGGSPQSMPTE